MNNKKLRFIDLKTTSDGRMVTLAIDKNDNVTLLGNLPHCTGLLITQDFVNKLQEYLDQKEQNYDFTS